AGCGTGSSESGGSVDKEADLQVGYNVADSLDPREAPEPGQQLLSTWPVYDRLIRVNTDAEYVPMLATDWEFSGDGSTLTLELRKDVTFSDGSDFDAEAVKANLEWAQDAEQSRLANNVAIIDTVSVVDDD